MDQIIFFLNSLYNIYEVPMNYFKDNEFIYCTGSEFQEGNVLLQDNEFLLTLLNQWDGTPFIKKEFSNICYGICQDNNGTAVILGPIALNILTGNELYHYKEKHNLLNYNDFIINNGSILRTAATLSLLHERFNMEQINPIQIVDKIYYYNPESKISEKDHYIYQMNRAEQALERLPYTYEKALLNAISNGNIEFISTSVTSKMQEHIGLVAKSTFKQTEYLAVSGITLFLRAALDGGADLDTTCTLSELYLQKISTCQDSTEIQTLLFNVQSELCELVRKAKTKKHGSPYIEQCKIYVAKHLHHQFALDDIANSIGINKCYLTNQFTKQEGKSLKRYIQEERIRAAQNMLKYSDLSISAIANYLCFDDQSHFGSVFKKITDITPSAYRSANKLACF